MLVLENADHAMLRHHARRHRTATAAVAHLLAPEAAPCEPFARAFAADGPTVPRPAPPASSDAARGPVREPGCQGVCRKWLAREGVKSVSGRSLVRFEARSAGDAVRQPAPPPT